MLKLMKNSSCRVAFVRRLVPQLLILTGHLSCTVPIPQACLSNHSSEAERFLLPVPTCSHCRLLIFEHQSQINLHQCPSLRHSITICRIGLVASLLSRVAFLLSA